VWRKHSNTNVTLPNDPLGGTIGSGQYNQWRTNFGRTLSGSGSGGGLGTEIQAVPEPTTAVLLIVGVLLVGMWRRPQATA